MLRPCLLETKDGRRLERDYDGHKAVERVELVEAFGHFNEVCYHFAALFYALAVEYFLLGPERGLVNKKENS